MDLLDSKRLELQLVNTSLFKLIQKRQQVSKEIQQIKKTDDLFDLDREIFLFHSLTPMLKPLSLYELLGFSLIMEDQANGGGKYPRWSLQEHLEGCSSTNFQRPINQINPILLFFYQMDYYKELNLNEEWKSKLSKLDTLQF